MTEKLQQLRDLLENTKPEETVPVLREDLEKVVRLAELAGLDASNLLERFDSVAQGYMARIGRQTRAIGEMVGRRMAAEDALRNLAKDQEMPPAVIEAFGGIISILRNGVKPNA